MKTNLNQLKVYIWTSNQQMMCLPAWSYLFNEFWPIEVEVGVIGYDLPTFELPDNIKYHSLGKQRGPEYWSNDMIDFFSDKKDEIFYLTTEDGFIVKPINKELLQFITDFVLINKNDSFLRFGLTSDVQRRTHIILESSEDFQVIMSDQNVDYRSSLQHSIWYGKTFVQLLNNNETPWHFESDGRFKNNKMNVFATKGLYAIHCGHGYKRGKKIKNWYDDANDHRLRLDTHHIEIINNKNWVPEL